MRDCGARVVSRESELAVLCEFADNPARHSLVLRGGPGIGKTTLWEAGVDEARSRGLRVLAARPSGAEAQLSFAALIDLLHEVDSAELHGLPAPQLHALQVALLRAEPTGVGAEPHAIAVGVLNALRALAADAPLVVAVDDVQWLDPPSADALTFAARRLQDEEVGLLLARRPGSPSALERALERRGLERMDVGPLSLGATRRLLSERLGLTLPLHVTRRVFESSAGNPLFALELGRTLVEQGLQALGDEIPVPDAVDDLLGTRVERLPHPLRRLLVALALSADLRRSELAAIAAPAVVDEAVEAGLLVIDGARVRASHPLLPAAAKAHSSERERRELRLELADVVSDEQLRARHLAFATNLPDAELAARVAAAAASAAARGGRQEAVLLAEHALRLTVPDATERSERVLELAAYLEVTGQQQRMTDLLLAELDSLHPGPVRGRAYLLLVGGAITSNEDIQHYLELALAESGSDEGLRAFTLAEISNNEAVIRVARIAEAEAWAVEALNAAGGAGHEVERHALYALGWARSLRGRPIDDLCERFRNVADAAYYMVGSPERVAGQRLVWRGETNQARTTLARLLSVADERGEPLSYALQRLHMCELELRVGDWEAAERLLDEWADSAEGKLLHWPMYERCRALVAVGRGSPDEAERWAAQAIAQAEAKGIRWDLLEAQRARGVAALVAYDAARAAETLRTVWDYTRREGVDDPGVFPAAPDLVDALVEVGDLDQARVVTARLTELAERQAHPGVSQMRSGAARSCASPQTTTTKTPLAHWPRRQTTSPDSACASTVRGRCSA